ncbi:glycosyltransferase [Aeromonas rivipollensis]|uniref:glycosyltransferase n=1 Tax=Aeromonas rivipollensis TaxID=948519 RepID=UPI003D1A8656
MPQFYWGILISMAIIVKNNFIINFKIKKSAKSLRKNIIIAGVNGNYPLVHSLINQSEKNNLYTNKIALSILCTPAVIRTLNEANNYFYQRQETDKAYECFINSLRLRGRQRELIDSEIIKYIDDWQPEKVQFLAEKGYEAYKHTHYLAIQALIRQDQPIDKIISASEQITKVIDNYLGTGKLKGFYLFYLKEKIHQDEFYKDSVYVMLRKGLKNPLIRKLVIAFLHRNGSKTNKPSVNYVALYLSTLVEHAEFSNESLSVTTLFNTMSLLPDGDEKTLLMALAAAEAGVELSKIEKIFFKLKKASSQYYFIQLVSGFRNGQLTQHFYKYACFWKTPTFIEKLFKQLFNEGHYGLIVELYSRLPNLYREQNQIFILHIGSLRNTEQIELAISLLESAPAHLPERIKLTQECFLYKKVKDFSSALQRAKKVYELQPDQNKGRWAASIVELMAAEGDFEAAHEFVDKHPEHAPTLLPLIHFKAGTLAHIERELLVRIEAGEQNDELHYYLSYLYCERKAYTEAIEQITEAIEINQCRRNVLHYLHLKSVVENDYPACLSLISKNQLDFDVIFATYYAHLLIKSGNFDKADEYLNQYAGRFVETEKGSIERKLLLANSARLAGNFERSFELFASVYSEEDRCFTSIDQISHSCAVMNLKSTAPIVRDDSQPLISVIMTNFGWSEYVAVAIQSILDQTHANFELLVIDDHSDKNAYRKLLNYIRKKKDRRIKLIQLRRNAGTYRAKNHGLSIANGDYITFQDSDDWSHPNRLREQLAELQRKNVKAVISNCYRITNEGLAHFHRSNIARVAPITLFINKDVFLKLGYFDSVRTSADSEYISRIISYFGQQNIHHIDTPLYIASYHERSLTSYGPLSLDPILGVNGARKEYHLQYKKWHNKNRGLDLYINFPLEQRRFEAPLQLSI